MRTKSHFKIVGFIAFVVCVVAPQVHAHRNDILIVPARARMIRLAFDLQALRGPALISYRETEDPLQPLLHVWNRAARDWQRVDIANISRAQHIPATPNRTYIIGLRQNIPDVLPAALSHTAELRILNTLSVADILTILDREMQFSIEEWRALAGRYDLEITELNHERRRWGRFGPPRRYRQQAPPDPQGSTTETQPVHRSPALRQQPEAEILAPTTEPETETQPQDDPPTEPINEQEALFEYLLEYEPKPLEPVREPEKGALTPLPPPPEAEDAQGAMEEDFPVK